MKKRIALAVILSLFFPLAVLAGAENSLCIRLKNLETDWKKVEFEVYQVGEIVENLPVIDAGFKVESFPVEAGKLDAAARKISGLLSGEANRCGWTDENGRIAFEGLADGVYLIQPGDTKQYGEIAPFLVPLPYFDEKGEWVRQLTIEPKASLKEMQGEAEENWKLDMPPAIEKPAVPSVVKTGDSTVYLPYLLGLFGAGVVCMILGLFPVWRKRGD